MCFSGVVMLGFVLCMPNMLGFILYISDSKCDINFFPGFAMSFSFFSLGSGSSTLSLLPLFEDTSCMLNFSLVILFYLFYFIIP
jgi:hypothetical protein